MKVCSEQLSDAIRELIYLANEIDNVNPDELVDELHKQADIVEALL